MEKIECVNCGGLIDKGESIIIEREGRVYCSDECIYQYAGIKQVVEDGYNPSEQTVKDFDIVYGGSYDESAVKYL